MLLCLRYLAHYGCFLLVVVGNLGVSILGQGLLGWISNQLLVLRGLLADWLGLRWLCWLRWRGRLGWRFLLLGRLPRRRQLLLGLARLYGLPLDLLDFLNLFQHGRLFDLLSEVNYRLDSRRGGGRCLLWSRLVGRHSVLLILLPSHLLTLASASTASSLGVFARLRSQRLTILS